MNKPLKISIVIAVYRNAGTLRQTYAEIAGIFSNQLSGHDFEILFVDDGSDDGSLQEILDLRQSDPRVKALTFTRNFGQMAAMLAGFKHATGDAIINVSADLQDPVELIPSMIQKWKDGAEIVIGHRISRFDSLPARVFSRLAYALLRLSVPKLPAGGFDFVLLDRTVLDAFNAIDVRNRFFQGDLLWTGYRTSLVPYVRSKRLIGRSQYNLAKKLKNFLDAFLDASYLSIRLISLVGIVMSISGLFYCFTVVYSWFRNETPFAGWAPIMIAIVMIGGLIMIMLGLIGEYIWRIYDEVRRKPNFIIRDKFL